MKRFAALILISALLFVFVSLDYSKNPEGSYAYYTAHWDDVGVPNLVTAILADWRGYDSLGEAVLLFASITGFYLLLGGKKK